MEAFEEHSTYSSAQFIDHLVKASPVRSSASRPIMGPNLPFALFPSALSFPLPRLFPRLSRSEILLFERFFKIFYFFFKLPVAISRISVIIAFVPGYGVVW